MPEILIEDVLLNADNPFKRTMNWNRLRCKLCGEIVLGKAVSNAKEWDKIRSHLKSRHNRDPGEGIPVRLLTNRLFKKWFKKTLRELEGRYIRSTLHTVEKPLSLWT